ncbi:MAG: methylated-DNA--[protein]-cysteine S-methyltransferase [Chloroflexota bacterium]
MTYYDTLDSPVGMLFIGGGAAGLSHVEFMAGADDLPAYRARLEAAAGEPATRGGTACAEAVRQLREYFDGTRTIFDLPLAPEGTAWQQRVWMALREIPAGETVSYGTIAARLGRPTASRAVGAANGRNPIAIVVPCHRVIGSNHTLTGYAGGLRRKQWLLAHEGVALGLDAPVAMSLAG